MQKSARLRGHDLAPYHRIFANEQIGLHPRLPGGVVGDLIGVPLHPLARVLLQVEALAALETPKAKALFEKYKVVSPVELHARHEIQTEIFHKEINIEAETALLMVETLYIPAVTEQLTQLTTAIAQMKASGIKAGMKATTDRANQIGTLLDILPGQVRELRRAVDEADTRAIQAGMDNLRSTIDMLESLTDADLWPVPTYAELLFL